MSDPGAEVKEPGFSPGDVGDVVSSLEDQPNPAPAFRPAVTKAKARVRLGYVIALLMALTAGVVTLLVRPSGSAGTAGHPSAGWWAQAGAHCTALEAATAIQEPSWTEVQRVTCLAVAGRLDDARARLARMSDEERGAAIQAVFAIAHPIADAGDDRSAGPIMALVVEYWPDNYMAVFHAGMAEFALGHDDAARTQLERFLGMYGRQDVWRARAEKALADIAAHAPVEGREAHFPE